MTRTATSLTAPDALVWQQLFWPQPFTENAALGLLRHWSAQAHAPQLILEARADVTGVEYLIGAQRRHALAVRRAVEQLVDGAIVTSADRQDRAPVLTARRLDLTTNARPLEPVDPVASSRSILHALTEVQRGERLVIQVVMGPRNYPIHVSPKLPKLAQTIYSRVLYGVDTEESEARKALIRKIGLHGFLAAVRVGVDAPSAERRQALILGLTGAIRTTQSAGVRLVLKLENARRINEPKSSWSLCTPSTRLNITEVARLSGWPVADREESFPGLPPRHPRLIHPSPAVQNGERIVALSRTAGAEAAIGYNVTDALRHTWIMGPNGVGKSTLLLNLIVQDLDANRPIVVIEPKDLIADVLARVPEHRRDDVVVLDPCDDAPVGINPLDGRGRLPELVADSVFGTLSAIYGDSLGPRSADILRNCLIALAGKRDASLVMLPLLLTNPAFRRTFVADAARDDPFAAGPFWQWFDSLSPENVANVVAPLSNKLRPLLTKQLRGVLAQPSPRFNVRDVLTHRKVLLVPLQKGVIGPESAQLLGALVIAELWQAIRERAGRPEASRVAVMVYIDEVQDYLRLPTDLGDALATARSLGAGFHVAHQYEKQLPPAMTEAFRNNARTRICFQLQAGDAREMVSGQSVLSVEDFTRLPAHHVYASLVRDNTVLPWVSGVTRPAPEATSNPHEIRFLSRMRYGQPRADIEASFAALITGPATAGTADDIGAPRRRRGLA